VFQFLKGVKEMLMKMFKMMKKGNKGFTLVELMVVVVIIGVLTAIAVPVYNNVTKKAKINAIAANLRIINGAVSQYYTNEAGQPADIDALVTEKYLQSVPTQPKGVVEYTLSGTKEAQVEIDDALETALGLPAAGSNTLTQATIQALIED
jgi:type IV pilus assembly protein PilA